MHAQWCAHTYTHTNSLLHAPYQAFETAPICAQLSPLRAKWNVNVYPT